MRLPRLHLCQSALSAHQPWPDESEPGRAGLVLSNAARPIRQSQRRRLSIEPDIDFVRPADVDRAAHVLHDLGTNIQSRSCLVVCK